MISESRDRRQDATIANGTSLGTFRFLFPERRMTETDDEFLRRYGIRPSPGFFRIRRPMGRSGGIGLGITLLILAFVFCVLPQWIGWTHPAFPKIGLFLGCLQVLVMTAAAWLYVEFDADAKLVRRRLFVFPLAAYEFSDIRFVGWLPSAPADEQPEALTLILAWSSPSGSETKIPLQLTRYLGCDDPDRERITEIIVRALIDMGVDLPGATQPPLEVDIEER